MSAGDVADGGRRCPECGAVLGEEATCEELFHAALATEWTDPPRTATAHHLLVATYMLQHPSGYTPEGRAAFARLVCTVVDEGLSGEELRERNRGRFEQGERSWNLKAASASEPVLREWSATIADVIEGAAGDLPVRVLAWACSVREDLRRDGL